MQKTIVLMLVVASFLGACKSTKEKETVPSLPSSVADVRKIVKDGHFTGWKAGVKGALASEIEWIDTTGADKFTSRMIGEATTLDLRFSGDSSVKVTYAGKTYDGTYSVDDNAADDEEKGIRLRLTYVDDEFSMGGSEPTPVTYSYRVEGATGTALVLETPRGLNNRPIMLWMKKQ